MNDNTIKDTAKILDIDRRTGSAWLKRFNESGVDGLKPKYDLIGRKCRMSDEQLNELENIIVNENALTNISEVKNYISDEFDIEYSYKQVWEITRKKFGLNYGKPFLKSFLKYKERPENYKEEFKKN